jgi:BirA family biotin operon repressor/biotin-[acetyl-CoA-carboxylase] ligase
MPTRHRLSWGAEALQQQLAGLLPGLAVEVVAEVGSTNTALLTRARLPGGGPDAAQACLLVAEHQTQGRGRQGKPWQSGTGASLTFSLALPLAPHDWSGLSLAVGVALAEALDPPRAGLAPRLGIKWPNDLLLRDGAAAAAPGKSQPVGDKAGDKPGRKLGGILIETVQVGSRRLAVVGVGLNLLPQTLDPGAPALHWGQASLCELYPGMDAPAALACVAAPLLRAILDFERAGFAPLRARFAARDLLAGRAVTTTLPGLPGGVADGVDDTGILWLRVAGGADGSAALRLPVGSGEVSLRAGSPDDRPSPPSGPADEALAC